MLLEFLVLKLELGLINSDHVSHELLCFFDDRSSLFGIREFALMRNGIALFVYFGRVRLEFAERFTLLLSFRKWK